MPDLSRPGVYVQESLQLANAIQAPVAGLAAFVGAHGRGPVDPTLITSFTQFQRLYGGFAEGNNLAYAIFQYISNGGRAAYVKRVVAADAVTATRTFQDSKAIPENTLQINAASPGAWGNDIYVEIVGVDATLFNVIVYLGGATQADIVERWTDLSMANVADRINSVSAGSAYIRATDVAPSTDPPADITPTALATGTDGTAVTAADVGGAVSSLDVVSRAFTLNLPGITDSAALGTAISYAEGRGDVFVVAEAPEGNTAADAATFAQALTASSYVAVYHPWLVISDPNSSATQATKTVPPGASVVGKIAQVDAARGVFKAPAGITSRLSNVVALNRTFTNDDLGTLHASQVNALKYQTGTGFIIAGARTLDIGATTKYIPVRRTLNYLKEALIDGLQWALFEPNNELLWEGIRTQTSAFLSGFWQEGGLRGASPDQAFYVKCDAELNTAAVIDSGEVRVEVGVAVQRPAEFIVIKIGQWEGGQSVVESAA